MSEKAPRQTLEETIEEYRELVLQCLDLLPMYLPPGHEVFQKPLDSEVLDLLDLVESPAKEAITEEFQKRQKAGQKARKKLCLKTNGSNIKTKAQWIDLFKRLNSEIDESLEELDQAIKELPFFKYVSLHLFRYYYEGLIPIASVPHALSYLYMLERPVSPKSGISFATKSYPSVPQLLRSGQ